MTSTKLCASLSYNLHAKERVSAFSAWALTYVQLLHLCGRVEEEVDLAGQSCQRQAAVGHRVHQHSAGVLLHGAVVPPLRQFQHLLDQQACNINTLMTMTAVRPW